MAEKRSFSIGSRLFFFSSILFILAISIMGVLFTFFLNSHFRDYLIQEDNELREELVSSLSHYLDNNPVLDQNWMEQFSNVYMEQGMYISLNSKDGELMWSCIQNNSDMCSTHMEETQLDHLESLETASYEVPLGNSGNSTLLNISYASPDQYTGNDLNFLKETYKMLLFSMIISLIISGISSFFLSKSMRLPLENLAQYAIRLANHDYRASDTYPEGIKEIDDLHSAISRLSTSLKSQESLRKRLTADISHELRTPLTSLQTSLEAMIDGVWSCNEERLQGCHDEISRLTTLVRGLDDLHSYDVELKMVNKTLINLGKSIHSVFKLFENDFKKKSIQWCISGGEILVPGDETKMKQVWINLISNSMKFVEANGKISIAISDDECVRIVFSDNGIGIDEEDIPNVFERFYKADVSRNEHGSGLGLSIVKEIIDLHKGSIEVRSVKNRGTDFIIELPGE